MAEFPDVGEHCSMFDCKQLDFLPFQCMKCKKLFCKLHKDLVAHHCEADSDEHIQTVSSIEIPKWTCSMPSCKREEQVEVMCPLCSNHFCLAHRLEKDHDCTGLTVAEKDRITKQRQREQINELLGTLESKAAVDQKSKPTAKSQPSKRNASVANKLNLMKLKMKASGDKGIPEAERVYLFVHLPKKSNNAEPQPLFFSQEWSVGRVIDLVASKFQLMNNNNLTNAAKLLLYDQQSKSDYETSVSLSSLMNDSCTLMNGQTVMLEYADQVS